MVTWGLRPTNDRETDSTADMGNWFIPLGDVNLVRINAVDF